MDNELVVQNTKRIMTEDHKAALVEGRKRIREERKIQNQLRLDRELKEGNTISLLLPPVEIAEDIKLNEELIKMDNPNSTNRPFLHSEGFVKKITAMHMNGIGYEGISKKVKDELGILVTPVTIGSILKNNTYTKMSIIEKNLKLKKEVEETLKKSLDRIDKASDIVWENVQRFKDAKTIKDVIALTTLIRSLKENVELNLRFINGGFGNNQTNVGTMNVMYNDTDIAVKVAKLMDETCKNCVYKLSSRPERFGNTFGDDKTVELDGYGNCPKCNKRVPNFQMKQHIKMMHPEIIDAEVIVTDSSQSDSSSQNS